MVLETRAAGAQGFQITSRNFPVLFGDTLSVSVCSKFPMPSDPVRTYARQTAQILKKIATDLKGATLSLSWDTWVAGARGLQLSGRLEFPGGLARPSLSRVSALSNSHPCAQYFVCCVTPVLNTFFVSSDLHMRADNGSRWTGGGECWNSKAAFVIDTTHADHMGRTAG